jgi:hypothetical protein
MRHVYILRHGTIRITMGDDLLSSGLPGSVRGSDSDTNSDEAIGHPHERSQPRHESET